MANSRDRTLASMGAAVLTTVLLTSCTTQQAPPQTAAASATSSERATSSQPSAPELPQGWTWVAGQDVPTAQDLAQQDLPASVTGDDGVASTVADTSRTIAGGDDIIEVFDALGLSQDIYAAPEESATQTGQDAEQKFLFNASTGVEGVLSLDGTLFMGNSVRRHSELAASLRATGMDAVVVDNLSDAPTKIRLTAAAVGLPAAGEQLAAQVQDQYAQAAAIAAGAAQPTRVLHISATGAGGNPAVGGAETAAADVMRTAGALNVAEEAQVANYSQVSEEGIVQMAPEVILLTQNDLEVWGGYEGVLAAYPTLLQTPAGQDSAFVVMPDAQLKAGSVATGTGAVALAEHLASL